MEVKMSNRATGSYLNAFHNYTVEGRKKENCRSTVYIIHKFKHAK